MEDRENIKSEFRRYKQKITAQLNRKSALYCICHTPYDAKFQYVECMCCRKWYHYHCMNIPTSLKSGKRVVFKCGIEHCNKGKRVFEMKNKKVSNNKRMKDDKAGPKMKNNEVGKSTENNETPNDHVKVAEELRNDYIRVNTNKNKEESAVEEFVVDEVNENSVGRFGSKTELNISDNESVMKVERVGENMNSNHSLSKECRHNRNESKNDNGKYYNVGNSTTTDLKESNLLKTRKEKIESDGHECMMEEETNDDLDEIRTDYIRINHNDEKEERSAMHKCKDTVRDSGVNQKETSMNSLDNKRPKQHDGGESKNKEKEEGNINEKHTLSGKFKVHPHGSESVNEKSDEIKRNHRRTVMMGISQIAESTETDRVKNEIQKIGIDEKNGGLVINNLGLEEVMASRISQKQPVPNTSEKIRVNTNERGIGKDKEREREENDKKKLISRECREHKDEFQSAKGKDNMITFIDKTKTEIATNVDLNEPDRSGYKEKSGTDGLGWIFNIGVNDTDIDGLRVDHIKTNNYQTSEEKSAQNSMIINSDGNCRKRTVIHSSDNKPVKRNRSGESKDKEIPDGNLIKKDSLTGKCKENSDRSETVNENYNKRKCNYRRTPKRVIDPNELNSSDNKKHKIGTDENKRITGVGYDDEADNVHELKNDNKKINNNQEIGKRSAQT